MGVILWTLITDLFLVISRMLLGLQANVVIRLRKFGNGGIFYSTVFITNWFHKLKTFFLVVAR